MDVLVLIDKLDDVVHNARPVPLTDQVRVDREEIYDLLDQMRATIPEEIKQARWIVKERQEMLAEAKREAERIVREAREQQARLISDEEVTKQAERAADEIVEDARTREREIRLGAEDYADEILNTLEVNLQKFLAAATASPAATTNSRRPSSSSRSRSFRCCPQFHFHDFHAVVRLGRELAMREVDHLEAVPS
jgi:cell division septum initiation protein DivIVA